MHANPLHAEEPVSGYPAEELIYLARVQMLDKFKFFGRLALRLKLYPTEHLPTAGVDFNGRLYYNRKFINACDLQTAIHVMAHEVMHLVQRCNLRMPEGAIHKLWNAASDIVVNQILEDAGIVPCDKFKPLIWGFKLEHQKYKGWYTEKVYYDLLKQEKDKTECPACKEIMRRMSDEHERKQKQRQQREQAEGDEGQSDGAGLAGEDPGSGGPGSSGDPLGDNDLPEHTCEGPTGCCSGAATDPSQGGETAAEDVEKWRRNCMGAAEGLERGDLPGGVADMIDQMRRPTVPWKDHIRQAAQSIFGKGRYHWKRPGRRSQATGIRFPSRLPDKLGALIYLDSSGSIGKETLIQFASECIGIIQQTGCRYILVGLHDVNVYGLYRVESEQDFYKIKFRRGGTSHLDVFNVSNGDEGREGIKLPAGYDVGMVVCMTDMMSEFPNQKPAYPVIWGVPSQYYHADWMKPSFGRALEIKI